MLKKILILTASVFIASTSTAQEILAGGTLEAYWADDWNDEATVNTPHLGVRYLTADKTKFIVLNIKGKKIDFIKKNFKNIPDNFFKRKEWYITQQGDLTVTKIKEGMLCNDYIYNANAIAFKPDIFSPPVDTAPFVKTAHGACNGDGGYPYITTFVKKNENLDTEFKSAPLDSAPTIAKGNYNPIVKIEKINEEWMFAGVYDAGASNLISPIKGYVRTNNFKADN
ncbi:hypothetical protein [Zymobacter palmae]|uniref:hypothetical protein n=1 Tax=Zymobacter palmae TaxID=33074 RepID=UPI000485F150|nr:hypothetical protein [Zymobacter palmae]